MQVREQRDEVRLGLLAMVLVIIGFSIGSPFVRKVGAPGPVTAFWRMVMTAGAWQVALLLQHRRLSWRMVRDIGPLGVIFGLNLMCFFTAATRTRIANVEMIGSMAPLLVFPLAALIYQERLRLASLAFAAPAFVGVGLVLFGGSGASGRQSWSGNALAVTAVGLWCSYLLLSRRVRGRYTTTEFMAVVSVVCLPVILPVAIGTEGGLLDVRPAGWLYMAALTVTGGTGAHGLLQWAQQRLPVSTISMMQVAQPALAIVWAYLLLDESIRPLQIVGVVVVMVSLALFTASTTRNRAPLPVEASGDGSVEGNRPTGSSGEPPG